MKIPLVIFYIFSLISVCWSSYRHGQPHTGNHNFWGTLIGTILQLVLIWWLIDWTFW